MSARDDFPELWRLAAGLFTRKKTRTDALSALAAIDTQRAMLLVLGDRLEANAGLPVPEPEPPRQDLALQQLLRWVREHPGEDCVWPPESP